MKSFFSFSHYLAAGAASKLGSWYWSSWAALACLARPAGILYTGSLRLELPKSTSSIGMTRYLGAPQETATSAARAMKTWNFTKLIFFTGKFLTVLLYLHVETAYDWHWACGPSLYTLVPSQPYALIPVIVPPCTVASSRTTAPHCGNLGVTQRDLITSTLHSFPTQVWP